MLTCVVIGVACRYGALRTCTEKVIVGSEDGQMQPVLLRNSEGNRADLDLFLKKLNVLHRL